MSKHIEAFTDGACRGNPGPGGWGVLLRYNGIEKSLNGAQKNTTNNRMELTAAIQALHAVKENCIIDLTTDSQYVKNGIETWIVNWKKNNWKNANKKPVKNQDLWQALDALVCSHQVRWHWVKGHSGHRENELVDELANLAIDQLLENER